MKNTKKWLSLLLALALVFACMPQTVLHARSPDPSGSCGTNLTWSFNEQTGALTISGTGKMTDWNNASQVPWALFRSDILTVSIGSGVESIGKRAFSDCVNLSNVTIANSVRSIEYAAFSRCYSLTGVELPSNLRTIANGAFQYCADMESITIGGSVETIGNGAFFHCESLSELTIEPGVSVIGDSAFENCSLTSVTIPASVTQISPYAFGYYYDGNLGQDFPLTTVLFTITGYGGTAAEAYAADNSFPFVTIPTPAGECGDNLTWQMDMSTRTLYIDGAGDMWDWPDEENPGWFDVRDEIETVSIGTGVTGIGEFAFWQCKLKHITIPDYVARIGKGAFRYCSYLEEITIPIAVHAINDDTFHSCSRLESITLSFELTSIGNGAFTNCKSLTSVIIPNTVESIGDAAFSGCTYLSSIVVPNRNCAIYSSATTLGNPSYTTVRGFAGTTTEAYANQYGYAFDTQFYGECGDDLTWSFDSDTGELSIGGTGEMWCWPYHVNAEWFFFKDEVKALSIGSGVTSIGDFAFWQCDISSLTIPNNVSCIETGAFSFCYSLTDVTIPNSITAIKEQTFLGCNSLESITFPASVASIGKSALYMCSGLTSVTVLDPNCQIYSLSHTLGDSSITTIYGYTGSTAETYANTYGYPFVALDAVPTSFTVLFDANGGSGTMAEQVIPFDTYAYLTANAFTRTGYTYLKWNTKADGSGTAYANKAKVRNLTSGEPVTLYAQWSPKTYQVKFYANGGTGAMDSISATYDVPFNLSANTFTREGYVFAGWNTAANGSGTGYSNGQQVQNLIASGTRILYAQWTPNSYQIAFKPNGGSGTMANQAMTYGVSAALTANAFTRTGYTFTGWNTKADGSGTAYTNKNIVKNLATTGTVSLYAQWRANTYTIKFAANGGTGTMSSQAMTYDVSAALTANAFTRTGYTFTGWNTAANGSGTAYTNKKTVKNLAASGTVTLYAQWKANTYTIRFLANSGTGTMANLPMTYGVSAALTKNAFTRTGYTFTGWNTASNGSGTAYTNGKIVKNLATSGTVYLYAQWKPNTYSIKFFANGGTGTMAIQKMTYNLSAALTSNAFTRTGYTFAGWNTASDGSGTAYTNGKTVKNLAASGTVYLYAQWTPNAYTIAFKPNGGSGAMANQAMTYGVSAALTSNAFTRTGYTFSGWNTMADGSGTTYLNGRTVKNLAPGGTVNLYAQWKANTYSVKFYANGGTGTMALQKLTYNLSATLTSNAYTRNGYTFIGWNTKADGSGTPFTDAQIVLNLAQSGTVSLYAQWQKN